MRSLLRLKKFIRKPLDILIDLLSTLRLLVSPYKNDLDLPDLTTLDKCEILPGDIVITKDNLTKLEATGSEVIAPEDVSVVGSVVGYSYPKTDSIVVAYFNVFEFQRPIVLQHKGEDLVVLSSPARTMTMAHNLSKLMKEGDFSSLEDLLGGDCKLPGEDGDEDDEEDGGGGVIIH